ncbi:MAG: hypothetical protein ACK4L7_10450, partial [Flavobacteriales bacterium]
MRVVHLAGALLLAAAVRGQAGWLPLSREVEQPFAAELGRWKSDAHTALRPYRLKELRALARFDSLRPAAALAALDRWSGAWNGRRTRWGPLLDLSANAAYDSAASAGFRSGAGAWVERDIGDRLTVHASGSAWLERLPPYLDSVAKATLVAPGEGHAYRGPAYVGHHDWQAYASWDAGRFFNFTAGRGKHFIGEGHRSLFLSDEATAYPYLRITTAVWRARYQNLFMAL